MTTTLIAKRTRVGGRIDTHGDVVIEGRVEGTIVAGGTVTVGITGVAVSDITAGRAVVLGIVIGNLDASERIDVAASARVVGDVRAPTVSLASPATVEGRVEEVPLTAAPWAPPESITASGQVTTSSFPSPRPTLRIRGGALVRPAKPDSGPETAIPGTRPSARPPTPAPPPPPLPDSGERRAAPVPVPPPPRPPGRARMLPHLPPLAPLGTGSGGRSDS